MVETRSISNLAFSIDITSAVLFYNGVCRKSYPEITVGLIGLAASVATDYLCNRIDENKEFENRLNAYSPKRYKDEFILRRKLKVKVGNLIMEESVRDE